MYYEEPGHQYLKTAYIGYDLLIEQEIFAPTRNLRNGTSVVWKTDKKAYSFDYSQFEKLWILNILEFFTVPVC